MRRKVYRRAGDFYTPSPSINPQAPFLYDSWLSMANDREAYGADTSCQLSRWFLRSRSRSISQTSSKFYLFSLGFFLLEGNQHFACYGKVKNLLVRYLNPWSTTSLGGTGVVWLSPFTCRLHQTQTTDAHDQRSAVLWDISVNRAHSWPLLLNNDLLSSYPCSRFTSNGDSSFKCWQFLKRGYLDPTNPMSRYSTWHFI